MTAEQFTCTLKIMTLYSHLSIPTYSIFSKAVLNPKVVLWEGLVDQGRQLLVANAELSTDRVDLLRQSLSCRQASLALC
jgi:hypothetical protein